MGSDSDDRLDGYAGRDELQGLSGNDTLSGGTEADRLFGGEGADTYLFSRGDGRDRIVDADATPAVQDVLQFGPGISADDLWLRKAGSNLVVGIEGTSDQLRICDWFDGSAHRIEIVRFADGTELLDTELQDLVQVMGAWRPGVTSHAY
jgi:Ca2+-binding RTX toxin-like protein